MKIEKKTSPEFFQAILEGRKNFEFRLADFIIKPGDILLLREWDPATNLYTGREMEKEVTYIIKTKDLKFWPQEEVDKYGYQIISIK